MRAVDYLSKVEPVCQSMFEAIRAAEISSASERRYLEPKFEYLKFQFESWSQIEDYDDLRLNYAHSRVGEAHQALLLIDTAAAAAAGAILQVVKLCVSMAWPRDERMQKGRLVGSQHLSCVIWHARNQALHFDEGVPNNANTKLCMELLAAETELKYHQLDEFPRSLAIEVIRILGWINYEAFARDMVELFREA